MFRSATLRLTLWYLAIVMAICLLFSAVVYRTATTELHQGIHREGQRISQQYPVFGQDPALHANDDFLASAHHLLLRLALFNLVVLVGAGFASYWLARRTLEPIQAAHEQQKRFTADVSHELRTPLTVLRMESEVALMNPATTPKELRSTLESNLEEVAKLDSLINNLLRLSRLEAEALQQTFSDVNLKEVIEAAVNQVQATATERGIALKQSASTGIVAGDRDSLVQLVVILLDNAIKYSGSGSAVEISAKPSGDNVNIVVADTGRGIPRGALEHVFDRFYRADESRSKGEVDGHGLGLSIAKMIAAIHRGPITISSRVGHGTTVTVSLPAGAKS